MQYPNIVSLESILKDFEQPKASVRRAYPMRSPKAYLGGETNRHTYSWTTYKYTSDEIIEKYYEKLVARSCEQCMNNPYARRFLILLKNKIIGPEGIRLVAQSFDVQMKKGKPDKVLDAAANQAIETAWEEWGKKADVTGKYTWKQIQDLVITTVAREGEVFARIIKGQYAGPWGFAIQLIDARKLDLRMRQDNMQGGNFIRFGIEFTPWGKPLKYYFINGDAYYYQTTDRHIVIPADEIIHIGLPEYIDQKRYLPWFSSVLMRMNMLGGYEDAAVEHARVGACQMGFIQNKDLDSIDDEDAEKINIEAEPASFPVLPPGFELQKFDPAYPNGEFDAFSKSILRGIASGLGLSYSKLSNDLTSTNYSALREGALDERDEWMTIQQWLYESLHEPVFQEWLKYSLLFGMIAFPSGKKLPVERIEKFRAHTWQPRRWPWVDPVKDINAAISSSDAGLRSLSDIIREQGRDPDDVWTEIQQEREALQQKGITLKSQIIQEGQQDATQNQ
jgi:lambda family phage portal protein